MVGTARDATGNGHENAPDEEAGNSTVDVNAVTEALITLFDLSLMNASSVSVETLLEHVETAINALNRAQYMVPNLERPAAVLVEWKARLNGMQAAGKLSEEDYKHLRVEVDKLYSDWHKHSADAKSEKANGVVNAVTESLVTLLDFCAMDTAPVDVLLDPVDTAITALDQSHYLVPQLEGRAALVEWKARLSGMPASDELSKDNLQQLRMDAENTYREFKDKLMHS